MGSFESSEATKFGGIPPGKMTASLNMKLRAVKWGEFKLTDVFQVKNTFNILATVIHESSGSVPYLCASSENNGVRTYIEYEKKYLEKGNCIFIGGKTFVVTYQKEDFFSNDSHNLALYLKRGKKSRAVFLFLASCIYKSLCRKYSWGDSISKAKIQNDIIKLPVKDGQIDFEFMEAFVAELEAERVAELSAYLRVSGLDNYELSSDEKTALNEYKSIIFADYDVLKIFDVRNTHNILSDDVVDGSGTTPYLGAGSDNNSISGYITYNNEYLEKGNCIFIGGKTFTISYQEQDFFSNDSHNLALYEKEINANKLQHLYIATCVKKSLSHKYSWGDSVSKTKIKTDKIYLPTKNGKPDYETMELLISAIQKLVIKNVVQFTDRKLDTYKSIVPKNAFEYQYTEQKPLMAAEGKPSDDDLFLID